MYELILSKMSKERVYSEEIASMEGSIFHIKMAMTTREKSYMTF